MPEGLIVKALSGYYYVLPDGAEDQQRITCRARGIFKKKGLTPLVGDRVRYELSSESEGTVTEILPRVSELVRPPISNVELVVLVFSVAEPLLNLQLLDKFLVHIENAGIDVAICLTKIDLASKEDLQKLDETVKVYREIGYSIHVVSSHLGTGVDDVRKSLEHKIGVFAGQSGVGKSSLLNALIPGIDLETSAISNKLGRGKHTTRHVELIKLPTTGWIADTPGFSQLDFSSMEAQDLGGCFPEFHSFAEGCRFRGCLHDNEPDCQVRFAWSQGKIAKHRYEHYQQFLQEIKEKKRRY